VTDRLARLEGLIDLRAIPFTEPGGRLLVRLGDGAASLQVTSAEYERSPDACGPVRALRFLDASGRPQAIEARTRPDRVDLVVGGRPVVLAFVDPSTLMLLLPAGRMKLHVETTADAEGVLGGAGSHPGMAAGLARCPGGPIAFGYASSAAVQRHERGEDAEGRLWVRLGLEAQPGDTLMLADGRERVGIPALRNAADVLDAAAGRWRQWLARVPTSGIAASEPSLRAAWVLAANTVRLRPEPATAAVVPSKMGYAALWQWDSCFHAIGLRHLDAAMARDQLRLAVRWQLPDGMLPDVVHDDGVLASSADMEETDKARSLHHIGRRSGSGPPGFLVAPLTKPPVTALAAWKLHQADPDPSFLAELYPAIVRSQRWWFERSRPREAALPIYLHPYSSGIDDSPLWDLGMPVVTPDLPAYLALQADHLALMAGALGREDESAAWRREAGWIVERLVARHWRARTGSFAAFHRRRHVPADTALGLIPLITGRLPRPIADRVVASLRDPRRFWPAYPVPSVALGDPEFDPRTMWRGPTWLFIDFLMVDGLRRAGYPDVAEDLRARAMRLVEQGEGMSEFYDPLDGTRPPRATAMFSGAAALYLDLLLGDPA
jgi:putative isomerase